MIFTILLVLFTGCISYLFYVELNHKRKYGHIPGPKGLPVVGNLFDLQQKDASGRPRSMQDVLDSWRYEFGPVFKFRIGPLTHVVFGTYDTINESMVTNGKIFASKPQQYRMMLTGDVNGLAGMGWTPLCKKFRNLCHRSLKMHSGGVDKLEDIVLEAFDDTFEKLRNLTDKKINVVNVMMDESTDILYILLFGKSAKYKEMTIATMQNLNHSWTSALQSTLSAFLLDIIPFLRIFPNRVYDACVSFRKTNEAFWNKQFEEHKETWNGEDENCFMDTITHEQKLLQETKDPLQIVGRNMTAMAAVLYMAGLTTLSSTMNSMVLTMLKDPDIQKRIYEEIVKVYGPEGKVTTKKRDMLPYTRAVIFETLRRCTPVPIPIPRESTEDSTVGGFFIPMGTPVMINVHGVHHDPDIWEDSYSFRPERFLDPDGNLLPSTHINRKRILSFGAGERVCVGELVALHRIFLFFVMFVQRFQLEAVPGENLPSDDPRDFKHGLIESPDSYNIMLVPR